MFVSCLLPYVDRGYGPLFHWVMLRQLASFGPEQISFVADERYFCRPAPWGEEMEMLGYGFRCPSETAFQAARKAAVPWSVFDGLHRRSDSMLEAYRTLLTEVYSPLRESLIKILGDWQRQGPIEAVVTWCNLPSLSRAAAELGLRVIHNELGPLRPPLYQPTVYFDFQGVNGQTSAREEMHRFGQQTQGRYSPLSVAQLRALFSREAAADSVVETPVFQAGVALQVEDDSNLIAFAGGRTNFDLIYAARKRFSAGEVLIRPHPHGHLAYSAKLGTADNSSNSRAFINRCQSVWTLNSSVAFECLLHETPVRVLGDSPAAALSMDKCGHIDPKTRLHWLNHLFLGYLTPARFLFDAEYYRWRLTNPSAEEICRKHLRVFEEEGGALVDPGEPPALEGAPPPTSTCAQALWTVPRRDSLLEQFAMARMTKGDSAQAARWEVVLEGESSTALYLQPPARIHFEIPTGAAGEFSTAVCLHPEVWENSSSGACEFHLRVDDCLALVLAIDPVRYSADRRWHPMQLPVPANSEGRHQIVLETRAAGVGTDFRWALWRDPTFVWEWPVGVAEADKNQDSERRTAPLEPGRAQIAQKE